MLLVIATNFLIFIGDDVLSHSILKHFQLTTGPQKKKMLLARVPRGYPMELDQGYTVL